MGAFAVGVGGAAPELAVCFAGGATAHGLTAEGTKRGAGLFGAGLDAAGVEALREAAVFFEIFGLTLKLAFQQVRGLIDSAKHGIGGELGLRSFYKVGETCQAGEDDLLFGLGRRQIGKDVVLQALAHGEAFAGIFVPKAKTALKEVAFVVLGELVVQAGPSNVGEFHLHFFGGSGCTAAFGDIADAAASGLDHLIVRTAAFINEAVAEDDGGVIDGLGDDIAAEVLVTAVGEEEGFFVGFLVGRVGGLGGTRTPRLA